MRKLRTWSSFKNCFSQNGHSTKEERFEEFLKDCANQGFEVDASLIREFRAGKRWRQIFTNCQGYHFDDKDSFHKETGRPVREFLYDKETKEPVSMGKIFRTSVISKARPGMEGARELLFWRELSQDFNFQRVKGEINPRDIEAIGSILEETSKAIKESTIHFLKEVNIDPADYECHFGSPEVKKIEKYVKELFKIKNHHRWNPSDLYLIKPERLDEFANLDLFDNPKDFTEYFNILVKELSIIPLSLKAKDTAYAGSVAIKANDFPLSELESSLEFLKKEVGLTIGLSRQGGRCIKNNPDATSLKEWLNHETIQEINENKFYQNSLLKSVGWFKEAVSNGDWLTELTSLTSKALAISDNKDFHSLHYTVKPSRTILVGPAIIKIKIDQITALANTSSISFQVMIEQISQRGTMEYPAKIELRAKTKQGPICLCVRQGVIPGSMKLTQFFS